MYVGSFVILMQCNALLSTLLVRINIEAGNILGNGAVNLYGYESTTTKYCKKTKLAQTYLYTRAKRIFTNHELFVVLLFTNASIILFPGTLFIFLFARTTVNFSE